MRVVLGTLFDRQRWLAPLLCGKICDDATSGFFRSMRTKLSDLEIQRALGRLTGWARRGDTLMKTYTFGTFAAGIAFVNRVAKAADAANHHPDIDIRYTKITCILSTHDAGGVTEADLKLADEIENASAKS